MAEHLSEIEPSGSRVTDGCYGGTTGDQTVHLCDVT